MRLKLEICTACSHLKRDHIGGRSRCQHEPCAAGCTQYAAPKRSKYGNRQVGGADSAGEANWFAELRFAEKAGQVRDLVLHHSLRIEPDGCEAIRYEADATFWERRRDGGWQWVIGDFKASITKTPLWRMKWKLTRWKFPNAVLRVVEHDRRQRGFVTHDDPPRNVEDA